MTTPTGNSTGVKACSATKSDTSVTSAPTSADAARAGPPSRTRRRATGAETSATNATGPAAAVAVAASATPVSSSASRLRSTQRPRPRARSSPRHSTFRGRASAAAARAGGTRQQASVVACVQVRPLRLPVSQISTCCASQTAALVIKYETRLDNRAVAPIPTSTRRWPDSPPRHDSR
ncbi:hypothetical protein ADK76_27285 [Streptomyces griseoflavus]|nr:hypothetical protein ADK76_27285 [Streptomyces griseoflavus]